MPEQSPSNHNVNEVAVPALPTTSLSVTSKRHPDAWGDSDDLDEITGQRVMALATQLATGCWYLNPRFTVRSLAPTAAFFAEVRRAQASWLRTARDVMGNHGQRRLARQSEAIGRHLSFSGVLFIDGELIDPPNWKMIADDLLAPDAPGFTISRRRVDLTALKATGDTSSLEQVAREAIRDHLATAPAHAAFITPLATISAPAPCDAFYLKADKHKIEWCCLLKRTIGNGDSRRLRRSVDLRALTLAFSGVLVVDGQFYLKGCWPGQSPNPAFLRKTPFNSPTVPPQFLGINP